MPNPTAEYSDFIIKDISSSYAQQQQSITDKTVGYTNVIQTIDGPMSLKGTNFPYTVTVSKLKEP